MTKIKKSRAILENVHELKERRYAGNLDAADELIDFQRAIELAKLTARQKETVMLVYEYGIQQDIAGSIMGVSKQRVSTILSAVERRLDDVYEYWDRLEEVEEMRYEC